MNKNRVRLTESSLHRIVKESVNKVLREGINNRMGLDNILSGKILDMLIQNGFDYDTAWNGYSVYDGDDTVTIKIVKQGNIPYPNR